MRFRNYLLSGLGREDSEALIPYLTEISLDRGEVLYEPDQPAEVVYFPSNAVLSIVTVMRDGAAVESSTIGHESAAPLLSALDGRPTRSRYFAQIAGAATRLPAAILRARATTSPALMSLLLRHIGANAFQSEQGVACNAVHDAEARLARWILMTHDRLAARSLPLTQDYMAIMTGVQRTTISGLAGELRRAGLIRYARGILEIVDRAGLEARACECYGAIRAEFDQLAPR